jgi:transposase
MVKAHDTVPRATSGYHGGKKVTGRGRHLAVDTEGWLLALIVTAASASDKAGAKILLIKLFDAFSTLRIMWADTGYNGAPLARYAQAAAAITVEVVARTSPHSFRVLRRRWVVERTFGWLMRYRRLARDYERTTANSEAMIYWATVIIMTRRLARYENGQSPVERWGGERPRPSEQAALSTGSEPADHLVEWSTPWAVPEMDIADAQYRLTLVPPRGRRLFPFPLTRAAPDPPS